MPELPEVETIKRDLKKQLIGKKITQIEIRLPRMIRKHSAATEVKQRLEGRIIVEMERRGKFLLCVLDSDDVLVLHLGMTGQLLYSTSPRPFEADKYTHVIFHFDNADRLLFRDIRQFGQVFVISKRQLEERLNLGPEPLSTLFTEKELKRILRRPTKIKQLLMDQKRIAGIGNIYSDEILYSARIHPLRQASSLTQSDIHRLRTAILDVLKEGIALRGTSVDTYVDASGEKGKMQSRHQVYRKEGASCPRCQTTLQRIKIRGRSSYFCPRCQK